MSRNITTYCNLPNIEPTDNLINYCLDQCNYMIDKCYCDCIKNDIPDIYITENFTFDINNILMTISPIIFIILILFCVCCKIKILENQRILKYKLNSSSPENEIQQYLPSYLNGLPQYSEIYITNGINNDIHNDINIIPPPYNPNDNANANVNSNNSSINSVFIPLD